jgi:hypothetical protein
MSHTAPVLGGLANIMATRFARQEMGKPDPRRYHSIDAL